MPAKHSRLAVVAALALALVTSTPAAALQAPDLRTVDLNPGSASSFARGFTRWNGWDYFIAGGTGNVYATELWRTNGSTTELLADGLRIYFDGYFNGKPTSDRVFAQLGSYLYFWGEDDVHGEEIWRTNGLDTTPVTSVCAADCDGVSSVPFTYGSYVYFQGDNGSTGTELYRTNGTTTSLVKDLNPGSSGSFPGDFTTYGGKLYFSYSNATNGWELGSTDGTSAGTVLYDLVPGVGNSAPSEFTPFANRLFFGANSQLWSLTSSEAPTQFYAPNGSGSSYVSWLTVVGTQLYFSATDGVHGRELWMTTGDPTDPAATNLVYDIYSGADDGEPQWLTAFGTRVYFAATDGTSGIELWSSNGSSTSQVADINDGAGNSSPNDLVVFAGALYLYANDGELWRITDSITATRHSTVPLWNYDGSFMDVTFKVGTSLAGDKLYLHTNVAGAGREYSWMQAPAAPASVVAPSITGTAKVGRVLTGARGSWSGVPSAITSAQWYRCTSAGITTPTSSSLSGCTAISGATKPTYKAVTADKGKYLRLRVKAQNESGSVYRWSKATGKIAP